MKWIVGLDLSLTAPAAVAIPLDWKPGAWKRVKHALCEPAKVEEDDLAGQIRRYVFISDWLVRFFRSLGPKNVVGAYVESYGFNKNTAGGSRLMESGGSAKVALFRTFGIVLQPVAVNSARKFLLGFNPNKTTGHNAKVVVMHTLYKRLKSPTWGEDVSDAFVIANYGFGSTGRTAIALDVSKTAPRLVPKAKTSAKPPRRMKATRRIRRAA